MTDKDTHQALMKRFMRGYAKADLGELKACISEDFVWHLHEGKSPPQGETLQGVEAMVEMIKWRQANWTDVKYEDMNIQSTGDTIVQTFRVSGKDGSGTPFDCRAVDLYPVRDGKITAKDTYWKNIG